MPMTQTRSSQLSKDIAAVQEMTGKIRGIARRYSDRGDDIRGILESLRFSEMDDLETVLIRLVDYEGYAAVGSVRGSCGHRHQSIADAVRCLNEDREGCASQGGYSDRHVVRVDGSPLSESEAGDLCR